MFHTNAFYWVLAAICLYAVATRGLFRATNGLRMSLIDLAAEITTSSDFPEEQKKIIHFALDEVYSAGAAWRLTFRLLRKVVTYPFVKTSASTAMNNFPRKLQLMCDLFVARWALVTVSNSVFASLIFALTVIIFAAFSSIQLIGHSLIKRRDKTPHDAVHASM